MRDLLETSVPPLEPNIESTIPPTMVIPSLINSDTYKQYRYNVALAAARAHAAGEVGFDAQSTWNESLSAIAYTDAELETLELANKLMNVQGVMISASKSHEPADTNTVSPVATFNMTESMRSLMRKMPGE